MGQLPPVLVCDPVVVDALVPTVVVVAPCEVLAVLDTLAAAAVDVVVVAL
jgi:hypothetical protein